MQKLPPNNISRIKVWEWRLRNSAGQILLHCDRAVESPGDVTHKMRQFSILDLYSIWPWCNLAKRRCTIASLYTVNQISLPLKKFGSRGRGASFCSLEAIYQFRYLFAIVIGIRFMTPWIKKKVLKVTAKSVLSQLVSGVKTMSPNWVPPEVFVRISHQCSTF